MMNRLWGNLIYAYQSIHRWHYLSKISRYVDRSMTRGVDYTIEPTGSRMTCFPPPMDTDQDWLVELKTETGYLEWGMYLVTCYQNCEKYTPYIPNQPVKRFHAHRRGIDNVIITSDAEFARRWRNAHRICKEFNLQTKQERVNCFELCGAGRHII